MSKLISIFAFLLCGLSSAGCDEETTPISAAPDGPIIVTDASTEAGSGVDSGGADADPPSFSWEQDPFCKSTTTVLNAEARCSYVVGTEGFSSGEVVRITKDDIATGNDALAFIVVSVRRLDSQVAPSSPAGVVEFLNDMSRGVTLSVDTLDIEPVTVGGLKGTKIDEREDGGPFVVSTVLIQREDDLYLILANYRGRTYEERTVYKQEFDRMLARMTWN